MCPPPLLKNEKAHSSANHNIQELVGLFSRPLSYPCILDLIDNHISAYLSYFSKNNSNKCIFLVAQLIYDKVV